jgi:aminoglycoside phosphotransferase (APT) family kinase protein
MRLWAGPPTAMSGSSDQAIRSSLETTRHRDIDDVRLRLDDWLGDHGGGRVGHIAAPAASGASSELFLVDLEGATGVRLRRCVLRLIGDHAVYPHVDPEMQYLCQRALNERSSAPVPKALAFESDPAAIGAAFILMERAEGGGAPDWPSYVQEGWIHDLDEKSREILWRNAIAAIAQVHGSDVAGLDSRRLGLPVPGEAPLDRLVAYWRRYLDVVSGEGTYPALDHAVAWLEREKPAMPPVTRLLWGDASLRNMLFKGLEPSALLDLEFAHIGVPHFDIAFFAMMDRVMAEAYGGVPRLTGFWGEDRTFDEYERLTGIAISHRPYFCRMAVIYMALANTRVFQRLAAEGRMPWDEVGRNPPLRFLARMFELPDPAAQ